MGYDRTDRLNSLLREVLSDVIRKDVKNPKVSELVSVTRVAISKDLQHAKVYISIIGDPKDSDQTLRALRSASGFIAVTAAKQVRIRHFPELKFLYDDGVEKQARMNALVDQVKEERDSRNQQETREE